VQEATAAAKTRSLSPTLMRSFAVSKLLGDRRHDENETLAMPQSYGIVHRCKRARRARFQSRLLVNREAVSTFQRGHGLLFEGRLYCRYGRIVRRAWKGGGDNVAGLDPLS
jgi:hypothetical protein